MLVFKKLRLTDVLFYFPYHQVRYKTCEPLWEEAFTFLVHNPHTQELQVEVWHEVIAVVPVMS